jgi:predicted transposase YdaD
MRTDTIFYQLFLLCHSLLFELLNQPSEDAEGYEFISAEVKEKAFRFDGIFFPPASDRDKPIYFVEGLCCMIRKTVRFALRSS